MSGAEYHSVSPCHVPFFLPRLVLLCLSALPAPSLPLLALLTPPKSVPVTASLSHPEGRPGLGDLLQVLRRLRASLARVSLLSSVKGSDISVTVLCDSPDKCLLLAPEVTE